MKKTFIALATMAAALVAGRAALADKSPELNNVHHFPDRDHFAKTAAARGTSNLTYHNGPVIHSAHVVTIFWGPNWSSGTDYTTAQHIIAFFGQFGTSSHWTAITQYKDTTGYVQTSNLGNTSWTDTSSPPTNVTDAALQAEVSKYLSQPGVTFDPSAIYEVFLPKSSYSSSGSQTSCGGPNLYYCAYHSNFNASVGNVKYASMPYPSCSGCQSAGFTDAQNFDHFSAHETREAVTDEDGNAWYDSRGNEADDKCAWSPAPFIDSGYGYQYEWSNSAGGCVK